MQISVIEIGGYAIESKTALWNGASVEELVNFTITDYEVEEKDLQSELEKAQTFVDQQVIENNWIIKPVAFINTYEIDIE